MMYKEFEELTGMEISFEDYDKVIEPMYVASNMNKQDFAEFIKPSVKPMAKRYKEEKQKAQEEPVFISTGMLTPNKCYYIGQWAMLESKEVNVKTGKRTYKVRELTSAEQRATGWDRNMSGYIDINSNDDTLTINWIG